MKNFFEKMHEIDRIIKLVVDMIAEWQTFQRHWMYLEEIFSLPEIQKQLEGHCKRFARIDEYFRGVIRGFELAVKVYVGIQREVVPHMV
jgi:Dynein heavy chain, N-terminal region 2